MFIDDAVLAVLDLGEIEARIFAEDAFFVRMLEVLPDVGRVEEGFGGDTTHQQAGTAEFRLSFDKGGFEAVLAGADGCGVAAGTTPDNNQIVWHFFYSTYDTAAGAGASKEKKLSAYSYQLSASALRADGALPFKRMKLLLILMLAGAPGFAQAGRPVPQAQRWPIASLTVEGNRSYSTAQVLAVAGLKVGQTAGKSDFEAARDRLVACGAFETVSYKFGQTPKGEGIAGVLQVAEVEQVYLVDFQDLHVSSLDLDAYLRAKDPIYSRERLPATQPVIERYRKWIEAYLASKGIEEKIAGMVAPSAEGGYSIVFRPSRPLPTVAQVTFEGNQTITQDKLREAIAGGVGAEYTEDTFRQVLNSAIRPLYEKQGFMRVAFTELRTEPAKDVNGVHVFVTVHEGLSYEMGKVSIEGATPLAPEALLKAGEFKAGEAANVDKIAEGVEKVRKAVWRAGYLDAAVRSERRIDEGKKLVNVALRVEAGAQYTMGRVTFAGLDLNGEAEMKRIWALAEGKPFNPEYPNIFLERVRQRGLFDNLGQTKADTKVNAKSHVVDVTLTFGGAPPAPAGRGRRGGRGD